MSYISFIKKYELPIYDTNLYLQDILELLNIMIRYIESSQYNNQIYKEYLIKNSRYTFVPARYIVSSQYMTLPKNLTNSNVGFLFLESNLIKK